jgi:hypothetical protein
VRSEAEHLRHFTAGEFVSGAFIFNMQLIHIKEGLRMYKRARRVKKEGLPVYEGTPEQIAEQIIDSCWDADKKYFRVSDGHFAEFYTRDFGMCAEALVGLGYGKQVLQTLEYALERFQKHGRITTSISPDGVCFDFPTYAADSLPFLVHALNVANAGSIVTKYQDFLKKEVDHYFKAVFDPQVSLVRHDVHFSSMKDYAQRYSSCYSNCMLSMLADDLVPIGIESPFVHYNIKRSILSHFWSGVHFYDDWNVKPVVTGDANTFPFWCGVTGDESTFRTVLQSVRDAGLDRPFPLKYSAEADAGHKTNWLDMFAGDYEKDSVWMHLGLCFLDVVKRFDPGLFTQYMAQYEALINKHKNFLEVYDRNGEPFHNQWYWTDDSMLWVSKWLWLKKS